jgi:5-methylcytosine-specific restriction endonuclease McrA
MEKFICTTCQQSKPNTEFYFRKDINKRRKNCRKCIYNVIKKWRIRRRNKHRAIWTRQNNSTKAKFRKQIWADKHKADRAKSSKLYRLNHLSYYAERAMARYALKKSVTISSNIKKIQAIYHKAAYLRKWFDVSVDHIIPIAKGGKHAANNLQIIYNSENIKKRTKLNYHPKVIFQ